ncbi:Crp/Fnr family transcriptional regulator [Eubacteriales bacterium OttesenSCG-928-A19]|nr:Crp/Fnr family transcriptional regulator [Eubacteriales bacterium OttesenSCG-928-A19]
MQVDIKLLQKVPLLRGIQPEEFDSLFGCVGARRENYAKGAFISLDGDSAKNIGIVLSGGVRVIKEDVFGNRAILNDLGPGDVFGESFVCGGHYALTVSVQATEDCAVLFLPFDRVMTICQSACGFHNTLVRNMVTMVSRKNVKLLERLEVATKHTLREKVLTYLSQLAQEQASRTVTSPLGRVDLADYLGVDRSALTRELNRMRDDDLIDFVKNTYTLAGGSLKATPL